MIIYYVVYYMNYYVDNMNIRNLHHYKERKSWEK